MHGLPPGVGAHAAPVVLAEPMAHCGHITEAGQRRSVRVGRGEPTSRVVPRAHLEMEAQLVLDVGIHVAAPEPVVTPPDWLGHLCCDAAQPSAGVARRTRATAAANSSQTAASRRKCARPAAVIT